MLPQSLTTVTRSSRTLALILFVLFPFLGFYLGYKFHESTALPPSQERILASSPTTTPVTSDLKTYTHYMDEKYGFTLNYPNDAIVEERSSSESVEEFTLIVKPYAKYSTDQSEIAVSVQKQDTTKQLDYYSPNNVIRREFTKVHEVISGILPAKIDDLPTYKLYYVECPGADNFFCNDYLKRSVTFINPLGYFFTIKTMHHTDDYGNPFDQEVIDSIVSSIHFLQPRP
ncbi:MAG: PsbP-related protein [Candidatus Shapirobacteria bacterium]